MKWGLCRILAQSRIPEAKLLIAGDGPESSRLIAQIGDLRLDSSVTLLGHLSRAELEARFSNAWVQVVPSRWEEPFGIVAAESLMRGTAVVASDAGGLAEIVLNNETGVLVPPGDPQALGDALLSLLENRERVEWMGGNARQFALQHLTEEAFV